MLKRKAETTKTVKKRYSYSGRRIKPQLAGAILAIMMIIVFFACYLRLSNVRMQISVPEGMVPPKQMSLSMIALMSVTVSVVITAFLGLYLYFNDRDTMKSLKQMLIVSVLITLSSALSAITTLISPYFTTMTLAVILTGILIKKQTAYSTVLYMAAVSGLMAFNTIEGGSQSESIAVIISMTLGGISTVFALNARQSRSMPIIAGLIGGGTAALSYMCVQAFCAGRFSDMLMPAVWLLSSSALCGVIATGLMPVFENLFDVATSARLNELMNNNNPLLKRLMIEAPGTYHHSMLVASIAEAAAETIGANPLLCKTAAYYHDVGKLRSPMHFKENQHDYNIHDDLDPAESAQRITAHQKDGVTLLIKYKLPTDIIKICGEHHGDSFVAFFYNKAIQQAGSAEAVDESLFRYNAPKPSTKESAILMLADCCEAAVRSIKQPTEELIEAKIRDVIAGIWLKRNGQLSEAPITAKDVSSIERSFIISLSAQYHERIEYPELEAIDDNVK